MKYVLFCFSGTEEELKQKIEKADALETQHCIVIDSDLEERAPLRLSSSLRYASITLNAALEQALSSFYEYASKLPVTDQDLKQIIPRQRGEFYDLLSKIDSVFTKRKIAYWGISGTLLGAIRHKGMIPWDDDIDIVIEAKSLSKFKNLKAAFSKRGIELFELGDYYFKLFPKNEKEIAYEKGIYPWKCPFVDVFVIKQLQDKMCIVSHKYPTENLYPGWFLLKEELPKDSFRVPFGPIDLPIPACPELVLNRHYGENWKKVAYAM